MTALLACGPTLVSDVRGPAPGETGTATRAETEETGAPPLQPSTGDTAAPCGLGPGSACDPFPVTSFPFVDRRDTSDSPSSLVDAYGCASGTDESGPEWWYIVTLTEPGLLVAAIDEVAGDGIDVDVHLLSAPDPAACLQRDHARVAASVEPGTYWLALDTWVDADGAPQAGPYALTVDLLAGGDCAYAPQELRMYWPSCAPSVPDCFASGGSVWLSTPTVGPVVKEAHLVTTIDGFGASWPTSSTDGLARHHANSEGATGYAMDRTEPWAPAGEGGSEYGQAAFGSKLPPLDEAWTINLYWRDRPTPGTRMIVRNPANGRAVVASGGYETGPGDPTRVAGVSEEVHDWLGTDHLDELELGFAADQGLPLGPIACP